MRVLHFIVSVFVIPVLAAQEPAAEPIEASYRQSLGGSMSFRAAPGAVLAELQMVYVHFVRSNLAIGVLVSQGFDEFTPFLTNEFKQSSYTLAAGPVVRNYIARVAGFRAFLQSGVGVGRTHFTTANPNLRAEFQRFWQSPTLTLNTSLRASYDFRRARLLGSFGSLTVAHQFEERPTTPTLTPPTLTPPTTATTFSTVLSTTPSLGLEFLF